MSKLTFIRLSGLAFVLGALAFVVVMTGLLRNVPEYNPNNYFSNPIDLYFEYAFTFLLPAAVFLWMVGMLGLYSRYKDEISGFGRFATLTGIIGGAISFLVTLTWSLQISFTEGEVDWWLFITGISLYFLALVVFGVASLRERLLPRWNALPIIASSWLLIVWLSSIFNLGDGILSDSIMLGLTLLSMLSLAALGVTLRSDAQEEIALA